MMASDVEDTDLDALRSAVLASLKPRGNKDTGEERSTKNDAELEELRKAALRSKRFTENNETQPNSFLQSNIQSNRGFRKDFAPRMSYNSRPNLIVIQPVHNEQTITNSSFTINNRSKDESSMTIPQRGKSSGKFSRFESDSDSSEDEFSEDEDPEEKGLSETNDDEEEEDDEERETRVTDDNDDDEDDNESVLLLHPQDELPDSECTLQSGNSNLEIKEDDSLGSKTSHLDSPVERRLRDDTCGGSESRDEPCRSGKSSRHSDRQSRTELRSIKENNDGRNRSERRLKVPSRNGDRRHRRNDDERRKRKVTSDESSGRRIEVHRTKNGKERLRVKSRNVDESEMSNSQHRSKLCVVGDDKMPSVVVTSRYRRPLERESESIERETIESSPKDSSRSSYGDSNVLRSRNSSPSSKPLDLREKLRLRQRNKDGKDGFEKNGRRGEVRSGSNEDRDGEEEEEDDDVDPRKKRSLTERDRTIVRSVLSVVKVTPASSEVKSRSRSPLPTRERRSKPTNTVRRKSNSPIEFDRASKSRRIVINDGKSASRVNKRLKSPQIDIIITDDVIERSRDSSPVHRIPVRQRLGVPPNSSGSSNFRGSSPSSRRCSVSPHPAFTERRSTSPSSTTSGRSHEPKRKVKLRRDAFAPSSATDLKHELSSGKSRIQTGRPTFENELDEKIRRIQANNEAILKRKYEIAWDQHKHH